LVTVAKSTNTGLLLAQTRAQSERSVFAAPAAYGFFVAVTMCSGASNTTAPSVEAVRALVLPPL